jgi:hypothetical protein
MSCTFFIKPNHLSISDNEALSGEIVPAKSIDLSALFN